MGLADPKCTCSVSVPPQRPPEKCRYAVGSVLCEGEEKPDEELQKMYEKFGFKVFSLPEVSHAVTTTFPCTTSLSYVLGPYRVYPKLGSYIEVCSQTGFPLFYPVLYWNTDPVPVTRCIPQSVERREVVTPDFNLFFLVVKLNI